MSDNTQDDFYAQMDANPLGVYLVEVYDGLERRHLALFSTIEKAKKYCDTQSGSTVCCPFIIDEPDFGNARKQ